MLDTNYKVRAWMGANKVSGRELAKRLNMPYSTFCTRMSEESDWKLPEIKALQEITRLAFEELF